jgi:putative peptidoglycan lipid II flippase
MTSEALLFYSVGLWAFSCNRVIVSGFYALQDTKTPVKIAVFTMLANLVFSLLLMGPLRHSGLALALSLASSIQFCLLVFFIKRKLIEWEARPVLFSMAKVLASSAIMGFVLRYLYLIWLMPESGWSAIQLLVNLIGVILIGVIIYFTMARILGCRELLSILNTIRPILKRSKNQ